MSDGAKKDIFGYTGTSSQVGGVLNFQNAAIKIGNSKDNLMLVQSATLRYTRNVSPVMGAGTTTVYLVPQPGTGQLDVNRAIVSSSQPLKPYQAGDACEPENVQIALIPNGCKNEASGSISADGLLSSVTIQINVAGGLGLQDGASWVLTNLQINSNSKDSK